MLKLASDDIQRQRMLHNCMQKSEHFTIDEVVKNWQELFNKLINENKKIPIGTNRLNFSLLGVPKKFIILIIFL